MEKHFIYHSKTGNPVALGGIFCKIERNNTLINVCFGFIGSSGIIRKKNFKTIEEAEKEVQELILQKIKKGYREKI